MKSPYEVLIKPIITEKSTALSGAASPQYAFQVHPKANKVEIRQAVEAAFGVNVTDVNTMNMLGKKRRMRVQQGRRPNWKKAIVTIRQGQQIPLY